jgi:hypothetical protein
VQVVSFFIVLISFLSLTSPVFAVRQIYITGNQSVLYGDEEITLTASASGFTTGELLLIKGAFYKEGSTNYFGYTKNGNTWVKNSTKTTDQRSVNIGSWDGNVTVKSDYSDSGFSGNGNYLLKVGFYTIAKDGDPSSVAWSENSLPVALEKPPPTQTPAPTQKPTTTPKPTDKPASTSTIGPTSEDFSSFDSDEAILSFQDTEGDILPEAASTESAEYLEQLEKTEISAIPEASSSQVPLDNAPNQWTRALPFIYGGLITGILSLGTLGLAVWSQFRAKTST